MKKIWQSLLFSLVLIISIVLLSVYVKGDENIYHFQTNKDTRVGGPFESSNTNSRYLLTEYIVTKGSYLFEEKDARFAAPDLVYHNEKFFSIFTPGVSFVAAPFYWLGTHYNLAQLFAFFTTVIVAIVNIFLVARLSSKFGANKYISYALGLTFLFATNALAYSLTLTQHHYSIAFILLGILNALAKKRTVLNNTAFGIIFISAILMDIPNAFMMLPIAFYILWKHLETSIQGEKMKIFVNPIGFWTIIVILPLLAFFGYYNYQTTGSYTKLAQSIGQSDYFDPVEKKQEKALKKLNQISAPVNTPFDTRKQLSGFYILFISDERGILYYSPVIIAGIIGLLIAYRTRIVLVSLVGSVILVNIVLYVSFGDPWGGWSFGPRYLIPATALLIASIGAISLIKNKAKYLVALLFIGTLLYSLYVNTAGALTTNAIPPKVEAVALAQPIPYTYQLNMNLISQNKSSSLLYNTQLKNNLNLSQLHLLLTAITFIVITTLFSIGLLKKGSKL